MIATICARMQKCKDNSNWKVSPKNGALFGVNYFQLLHWRGAIIRGFMVFMLLDLELSVSNCHYL